MNNMMANLRHITGVIFLILLSIASCRTGDETSAGNPSLADIRNIAKEAYIYGYPLVDNYRFLYARSIDSSDDMYRAPFNQWGHEADVMKAGEKAVQTVNTETPYSRAVLDFRSEPVVLTVPTIEKNRYYSMQMIDLYTHNYAYVGTRTEGNSGASFLLCGPGWKGEIPSGIKKVIHCETSLMTLIGRTQLFGPEDLPNVKKIQAGYQLQSLSEFLGKKSPSDSPKRNFIRPLGSAEEMKDNLDFFRQLNFVLGFCPTHESEKVLMEKFALINVGPGLEFDTTKFSIEVKKAIREGIADAWASFADLQARAQKGEVTSADIFGTREELKNNYLFRWAGDILGIYGNTAYEAIYPGYETDAEGESLDAAKHNYSLRLMPDSIPANAFWSITMYDMPARLLVSNPLDRYVINKPMLPKLRKNVDGSVTIYIQAKSPGKEKESNWLPAPAGPFFAVMRLYWPKPEALDGSWKQPPLIKQNP